MTDLNFSRRLPRSPASERIVFDERPKARVPYNIMKQPLREGPMRPVKRLREEREGR